MVATAARQPGASFDAIAICPGVVLGEAMCRAHTKASPVFVRELLYRNKQMDVAW